MDLTRKRSIWQSLSTTSTASGFETRQPKINSLGIIFFVCIIQQDSYTGTLIRPRINAWSLRLRTGCRGTDGGFRLVTLSNRYIVCYKHKANKSKTCEFIRFSRGEFECKKYEGFQVVVGKSRKWEELELEELNHEKRLLGCCSILNDNLDLHEL